MDTKLDHKRKPKFGSTEAPDHKKGELTPPNAKQDVLGDGNHRSKPKFGSTEAPDHKKDELTPNGAQDTSNGGNHKRKPKFGSTEAPDHKKGELTPPNVKQDVLGDGNHRSKPKFTFEEAPDEGAQGHQRNELTPETITQQQQEEGPALAPKPEQAPSAEPVPAEVEDKGTSEAQSTPVFIKMSGSNVEAEKTQDNSQVQKDVSMAIQKVADEFNAKAYILKQFAERIQQLGKGEKERLKNKPADKKVAPAKENETEKATPITTLEEEADPKALSDEFRTQCEEKGLGLETIAWRDGDSVKFEITKATNRDDLAVFEGYTVSISGLQSNEALVDFVSAVRVAGFEKAVEYMNKLDKNNQVELTLLDKEGKKIEDKNTLNNFKRLTVPREQLEDLNISKEEQHFPASYLDSIGNKSNIASNGTNPEEDSDIKNPTPVDIEDSTSIGPNNSIVLESVLNARNELESKTPQQMIMVKDE